MKLNEQNLNTYREQESSSIHKSCDKNLNQKSVRSWLSTVNDNLALNTFFVKNDLSEAKTRFSYAGQLAEYLNELEQPWLPYRLNSCKFVDNPKWFSPPPRWKAE